jgi:acyl-[acyl-carrier-protein] desaturase
MSGYMRKAAQMARAGIYDLRIHHDEVIWPILRHWRIFELEPLSPRAEARRNELATFLGELDRQASRFEARRAAHTARVAVRAGYPPINLRRPSDGARPDPAGRAAQ